MRCLSPTWSCSQTQDLDFLLGEKSTLELMENIDDEYNLYWETKMFLQNEELDRWGWDDGISGYSDSSSPDRAAALSANMAAKNIVSERNRRKKLKERLFALRAVVPNITKMDKASIIKDAIDYIQELHEQERKLESEISELECGKQTMGASTSNVGHAAASTMTRHTRRMVDHIGDHSNSSIEILQLSVTEVGERTSVISLTCSKKTDTMVKLCEVFQLLNLRVITSNITALSDCKLLKTVLVEVDEGEKAQLKEKIEKAIANMDSTSSSMIC